VGFEPTTLALYEGSSLSLSQRAAAMETKRTIQIPPAPSFFVRAVTLNIKRGLRKPTKAVKQEKHSRLGHYFLAIKDKIEEA
jgi:hypothetical protein